MINIRKSQDRGTAKLGWLDSKHTFSFADYHDPEHMGFGSLRVINEDWIQKGKGFGTHPHRDMEIITYIIDGALEHKDSMGNGSVMRAGEVQRMTAGTGVTHSEFNPSLDNAVHLLQIWILPSEKSLVPGYEQKSFPEEARKNRLRLIASPDGRDDTLTVHQDIEVYASVLTDGTELTHEFTNGRKAWIQVVSGSLSVNDKVLSAGDGAAIEKTESVELIARGAAEIVLFDMGAL